MATVLVEYLLLDRAGERERDPTIIRAVVGQSETLSEILDAPVLSRGAPAWGKEQGATIASGYARVTVQTGAVRCAWGGQNPDPTNGLHLAVGDPPAMLEIKTAERIGFVQTSEVRLAGAARADLQQQGNDALSTIAGAIADPNGGLRVRPPTAYPSAAAPIAGVFVTDSRSLPFSPDPGRPINLHLFSDGPWTATIQLLRKLPGEDVFRPLTLLGEPWAVFTSAVNEPVWEESEVGAQFALECVHASGAISYRVSQ